MTAAPVTLLFTDLVNSTELLQRVGDERAQRGDDGTRTPASLRRGRRLVRKAHTVPDEQGARPLRAIVDYDGALTFARGDAPGDRGRARPLVDAALAQFRTLGMPGWIRRAEALLKSCAAGARES